MRKIICKICKVCRKAKRENDTKTFGSGVRICDACLYIHLKCYEVLDKVRKQHGELQDEELEKPFSTVVNVGVDADGGVKK